MIITTTNSVEGYNISEYLGILNANIVVGTNVFADIAASFSDFFGGSSNAYQRQLQSLYDKAASELEKRAVLKGASAVVGVKLDFGEISGKGKSMFMLSMSGTAVRFASDKTVIKAANTQVSSDQISNLLFINQLEDPKNIVKEKHWEYLNNHYLPEAIPTLLKCRDTNRFEEYSLSAFDAHFTDYLLHFDSEILEPVIYDYLETDSDPYLTVGEFCFNIISKKLLFSPGRIKKVIDSGKLNTAIRLLDVEKPMYSSKDLMEMKSLLDKFDNLPQKGTIEESKGGFLSDGRKKYICPDGHKNDVENEFCTSCGKDIYGLTSQQRDKIDNFRKKVEALEQILNRDNN